MPSAPPVSAELARRAHAAARDGGAVAWPSHLTSAIADAAAGATAPVVAALTAAAGPAPDGDVVAVPGRAEGHGVRWAALLTGASASIGARAAAAGTYGAPVLGAVLPLALQTDAAARRTVAAFTVGAEVQLRLEAALAPVLGDDGWDAAGVGGVIAAAVGAGLVLDLDPATLTVAVNLAASQTLGLGAGRGTDLEAVHAGKAAQNAVLAARLAATGFTAATDALGKADGYLGYFAILGVPDGWAGLLEGLGEQWLLADRPEGPERVAADLAAPIRRLVDAATGVAGDQ